MADSGFAGLRLIKAGGIYAALLFLFFMSVVDIPVLPATYGRQAFFLSGLYYFLIFRPRLLPYPLVFALGLILDFVSGGLVGLYALCFMVIAVILRGQRRYLLGQSWIVVWAGFCVGVCGVVTLQSVAYAAADGQMPAVGQIVLNILISSFVYPLFLPVMTALNRSLSA